MRLKNKQILAIKSRIYDYVVANYQLLDSARFVLGDIPYNYKCQYNAVQKVKEGKAVKVYACVAIHKNDWRDIIVHFINGLEDGRYQDNTWGWVHQVYNYYLVKEVNETEYDAINEILNGLRESLVKNQSSGVMRKIFRIDTHII